MNSRLAQTLPGKRDGLRVPVDPEHLGAATQQHGGMATISQGGIHSAASPVRGRLHRLQQNRDVVGRCLIRHRGLRDETQTPSGGRGARRSSKRAGLTGLEPATSAVTVRHSNQAELQPQNGGRNIQEPWARGYAFFFSPLQYAFSMEAIRGLYFVMIPRFLSTASGFTDRPAVSAESDAASSACSCLARSHDFCFSAWGSIWGTWNRGANPSR